MKGNGNIWRLAEDRSSITQANGRGFGMSRCNLSLTCKSNNGTARKCAKAAGNAAARPTSRGSLGIR